MPTTPPPAGPPRPAAVVQEDIRALMQETGGWLWGPTREQYEALRVEVEMAVKKAVRHDGDA